MKFTAEINDKYVPGLADKFYQHDPIAEPLSKEQQEDIVRNHYEEILKLDVSDVISTDPEVKQSEDAIALAEENLKALKAQKLAEAIPDVTGAALAQAATKI